jgi:ferredoxin
VAVATRLVRGEYVVRVSVDADKCSGHGLCNAEAPDIYELDDLGYCVVRELIVPTQLERAAAAGASRCPERAITIFDESPG